jgi:hypothetical protein
MVFSAGVNAGTFIGGSGDFEDLDGRPAVSTKLILLD